VRSTFVYLQINRTAAALAGVEKINILRWKPGSWSAADVDASGYFDTAVLLTDEACS
jgi:hypothetical protein